MRVRSNFSSRKQHKLRLCRGALLLDSGLDCLIVEVAKMGHGPAAGGVLGTNCEEGASETPDVVIGEDGGVQRRADPAPMGAIGGV